MTSSRFLLFAALGGSLLAQNTTNDVGFTRGWTTSFTDRIGANNIVADCLNHYDSRSYQDWILDPADPTGQTYKFNAVRFVIQDQVGNTPETYNVVAYNEDPANANFPDPNGVWLRSGNFTMPASTSTGGVAWIITITLTTPPAAPKGDKWIGLQLSPPAAGTWPTDGASLHCAFDRAAGSTATATTDQAGIRIDSLPNNNFACNMPVVGGVPTGPAIYPAGTAGQRRQIRLEILADTVGGVCVTQTNQTSYTSSNPGAPNSTPLGGTTNFISGLQPDVYDGSLSTPARQDDIGFLVTDVNLPNALVIVVLALGPSPIGSQPLLNVLPGIVSPTSRGNLCVDFVNGITFAGISNAQGLYQQMLTLDPGTRAVIQSLSTPGVPLDFWYQGFVLNLANGFEVRASGCGVQHL